MLKRSHWRWDVVVRYRFQGFKTVWTHSLVKSPQITTEAGEVLVLILVPSSVSLTISAFQHPYCGGKIVCGIFLCNVHSQEFVCRALNHLMCIYFHSTEAWVQYEDLDPIRDLSVHVSCHWSFHMYLLKCPASSWQARIFPLFPLKYLSYGKN